MSPGLMNMFVTFISMGLMFISAIGSYYAGTKLKGIWRGIVLTISFICLVIAGFIVFLIVVGGPTE